MNLDKLRTALNESTPLTVKNYPATCELLDEPRYGGDQKKAQLARWEQFFRWQRKGNAYIVFEIYDTPKPKPFRSDEKYSLDVLTCLRWDWQNSKESGRLNRDSWCRTYSLPAILALCGFVRRWWGSDPEQIEKSLREYKRFGLQPKSNEYAVRIMEDLDKHIRQYCANALDRSLQQLKIRNLIIKHEKTKWVKVGGGIRRATPSESLRLSEISNEVKQGLGISYINLRNRKAYHALLNKRIRSEMSLDGAFPLREIVLAEPFDPVSEDEYHEACKRINAHSLAEFNHLAKTDTQKDLSKAKSLLENACAADEELAYFAELFPWTAEELYEDFYGETPEEAEDGRAALASWFIELGDREAFLKKKHEIDSWVAAQQKIGSAAKSDDR